MIYKIRTMGSMDIVIESDEDLIQFLTEANAGKKLIITKHGIVNVASIDSITAHDDMNRVLGEKLRYIEALPNGNQKPQYTPEEALRDTVGSSPFAKLLADKMGMLTHNNGQKPTKAQMKRE